MSGKLALEEIKKIQINEWVWVEVHGLLGIGKDVLCSGYYKRMIGPGDEWKIWVGGNLEKENKLWRKPLFYNEHGKTWDIFFGKPMNKQMAADSAQIVKCERCKHWERDKNDWMIGMCEMFCSKVEAFDFCSRGERKND